MPNKKYRTQTKLLTKTMETKESAEPPRMIGDYKILEEIGKGGMGTVYLAQQERPIKRKVALKVIKPGLDTKDVIARFESEQQALALMNHPNIAQVYDSGETPQGNPYFVMEHIPGLPVTDYCDKNKMTIYERLRLFEEICDAIQHAHFRGIIHRDIKSTNVLVTYQDEKHIPKVIDFGIAKAVRGQELTDKTLHTMHGVGIGTPMYMSPEQAELTGYDVDTRTDVYSLGVLLYELLVGVLPFGEDKFNKASIGEVLRIIREEEPPRPSTRFSNLTEDILSKVIKEHGTSRGGMEKQLKGDLDWIVLKAIEKDKRLRYGTPAELADDLRRYVEQEPVKARPPSILYKTKKIIRRHKAVSFSAISIFLLIIIFSLWNMLERQKAERSLKEANYNFAIALKEKAKSYVENNQWQFVKLFGVNSLFYQAKAQRYLPMNDVRIPLEYNDWILKRSIDQVSLQKPNSIRVVSFSPDGRYLASGGEDATVKLWDVSSGKSVKVLGGNRLLVYSVSFSADGKHIAAGSLGMIKIWEVSSGKEVHTWTQRSDVYSVSFSPDGRYLASGSALDNIKIYDVLSGGEIATLKGHQDFVYSVSFSPDGKYLASGGTDKTIRIWDVSNGREITTISGHKDVIVSLNFSPDGKLLASGSRDTTVKVWDAINGKEISTLDFFKVSVKSVSFNPDGKLLAVGCANAVIKICDASTWREIATLVGHGMSVTSVCFSPEGNRLASGSLDEAIKIWELVGTERVTSLTGAGKTVTSVSFSPDGRYLASGSDGDTESGSPAGRIKIWDVSSRKEIAVWKIPNSIIRSVCYSPDGKYLASGGEDATIKIWDVSSGKEVRTLKGHRSAVMPVSFSPDGKYLASGSVLGGLVMGNLTVKIWDIKNGTEIATLEGQDRGTLSLSFSPDEKYLASGGEDTTIKIWDVSNRKEIATLKGHKGFVSSVNFSPDGKRLASASGDSTIKIWDVPSWKEIATLAGHELPIYSVSFSPDGKQLASGSIDRTIKIWDVSSWKEITTLVGHGGRIFSLSYSPDGRLLASCDRNKAVKIWDMEYILNYFWLGLGYPYKEKDTREILEKIKIQTGFILEGMTNIDVGWYLNRGSEYIRKGEYVNAIDVYNTALKIYPNNLGILYCLGHVHFLMGNYDQAIENLNRAIEIDRWYLQPQYNIALIYLKMNEFVRAYDYYLYVTEQLEATRANITSAIEDINEVLEKKPELIFAYLIRGYLNMKYGTSRALEAKEDLDKFTIEFTGEEKWKNIAKELLSEKQNDPIWLFRLGNAYKQKEEYDKAIDAYKKALKLNPKAIYALINIGEAYYSRGEYDQAIISFEKAIEIDKKNEIIQFNLALTYLAQGSYKEAYDSYRYVSEELQAGKYSFETSIEKINDLLKDKPGLTFAYLIRGYLYSKLGEKQQAKEDLNRFLDSFKGEGKWKRTAENLLNELSSKMD